MPPRRAGLTTHQDLAVYVLPGRVSDPGAGIAEAAEAEAAGFGAVYVSERLDLKDAGVTCGAVVATTDRVRVGTALIHQSTRHPLAIAAMAATLQTMSGGRFVLGLGRGLGALAPSLGVPPPTLAGLEHLVSVLRRLWAGERITEAGPAGSFRGLRFTDLPPVNPPPVLFGTIGPRGLELAGRAFDGVILHPFLTVEAVRRSVKKVREAAERAGRDSSKVRIVSTLVAAPGLSAEREDIAVRARAVSYLQVKGLGELLADWNGWDPAILERLRNHATLAGRGIADTAMDRPKLVDAAEVIPEDWLESGAALGTVSACIQRAKEYRDAGADEILIHGALPAEAAPMAAAWDGDRSS
jgi:5,10-methylenetetrahydromethanopterin reductase